MAKRILIADDSLTIQKAFAMTFAGEDVTLLAARSADEGLTIAKQSRPELVIADASMPGRSGYDLCSAIKSDPALRGVPVYILTSTQNPYDEGRGRQSGVDGQFTKPFESLSLVERVKEAIAKGATAQVPAAGGPVPIPATSIPTGRAPLASVASPPGMPGMPGMPGRAPAASLRSMPAVDDDYGEISIDPFGPRESTRPGARSVSASLSAPAEVTPPPAAPSSPQPQRFPHPAAAVNPPGMRPSLIPGLRPGAMTAARPVPMRPAGVPATTGHGPTASPPGSAPPAATYPPVHGSPLARAPLAPALPTSPGPARTLMGLPAAVAHAPARFGAPSAPARPATQPISPLEPRTPPPAGTPAPAAAFGGPSATADLSSKVDSKIDQKLAAIALKGPEYEALAKLSREIIERIVWEIVPELAEAIVREELQKRGRI